LPLDENILNIAIKTKVTNFSKNDFISFIEQISEIEKVSQNDKSFLNSLKKVVFKAETLPKIIQVNSKKQQFIVLCGTNAIEILKKIESILTENAKYLTIKSIKALKKESSKELCATLSDNTFIYVKFSGEFVSREKMIKLYDKNLDMTKFVNIIKISIK